MELSQDQIQKLFDFTQKKRVLWYDLQLELVDHLASKIEEEMTSNSLLSFEEALDRVYKSFGIFGFAKVVQEKSEQVQKTARRIWYREIGSFFTLPKVSLLVMMISLIWFLAQHVDLTYLMLGCAASYLSANVYLLYLMFKAWKPKKKLMLLQFGPMHVSTFFIFYQGALVMNADNYNPAVLIVICVIGILTELASIQVYRKVRRQAVDLYPEAFAA